MLEKLSVIYVAKIITNVWSLNPSSENLLSFSTLVFTAQALVRRRSLAHSIQARHGPPSNGKTVSEIRDRAGFRPLQLQSGQWWVREVGTFSVMKTEIPSRTVVPFPPIHQVVSCPDRQQGPRQTTKKVQPAASQPQPDFSHSWPKVGFQQGGRRPQPSRLSPTLPGSSCTNAPASASGVCFRKGSDHSLLTSRNDSGKECFSLSLTPEAALVIQKRSLERRQLSGLHKGKAPLRCPAAPACSASSDIGSLLKISLLNDQHKYDDVEYEEEREGGEAPDRSVLQKCQKWLQGVERARTPVGRLAGLPRLAN